MPIPLLLACLLLVGAITALVIPELPPVRAYSRHRLAQRLLRVRSHLAELISTVEENPPSNGKTHAKRKLESAGYDLKRAEEKLFEDDLGRCSRELDDAEENMETSKKCLRNADLLKI